MVFCNRRSITEKEFKEVVTILILIDGFLQFILGVMPIIFQKSHNPYFSRWFSAIHTDRILADCNIVTILILVDGFLQFIIVFRSIVRNIVTILILVDGFLQYI